jgi:hypothetical protein
MSILLNKGLSGMATTLTSGCYLLEFRSSGGVGNVDWDNGVIYEAKIIGFQSRNIGRTIGLDPKEFGSAVNKTYSYSRQALLDAISMYESAPVRVGHPPTKFDEDGKRVLVSGDRPGLRNVGEVRNVRMKDDGLYGDIYLIKSHPDVPGILETASRMPDKIALSHNAYGKPVLQGGRAVIDKIIEVYSVDFVSDPPGTTNGLFETTSLLESAANIPTMDYWTQRREYRKLLESMERKATEDRIDILQGTDPENYALIIESWDVDPRLCFSEPLFPKRKSEQRSYETIDAYVRRLRSM